MNIGTILFDDTISNIFMLLNFFSLWYLTIKTIRFNLMRLKTKIVLLSFQYDTSSYGRSRDTGRSASNVSTERPTTVTAKYINSTPSYKSSSIPILSERTAAKDESPISTIASRYSNYGKTEKPTTKYEKKDYSKLTVPSVTTKSRDVSPISTSSKYSYNRPSRHLSPERRTTKTSKEKIRDPSPADREKDIPSKTDKSTGYSSLSSYKLYPRTSNYTRPTSRTESKPEVTVNRYAIASRLSTNYLRSPPTVKKTSVSPVNHVDMNKTDIEKSGSPTIVIQEASSTSKETDKQNVENEHHITNTEQNTNGIIDENEMETVVVVTRHTSPTPPGSSAYVRSRRAEMAKTIEKSITRAKKRPQLIDKEIQSDRLDDTTRTSRFGSTARANTTNWSYYSPNANSYTGYAGRYSTQYSTLRENSSNNSYNDRSSRSRSKEPQPTENSNSSPYSEDSNKNKSISTNTINNIINETNQDIVAVYDQGKTDDDTSEIVINVNLKLKRAKSPLAAATELVSPEVTITNSQLPPQAPKSEGNAKVKKTKMRKSSTDSSSDSSSKKKIVKKRSKSVSSTDSDQGSEPSDKSKDASVSPPKSIQKNSSSSNIQNGLQKLKHSKSRESHSPESSVTLSTQSSVSEDDTISKSKTHELSRTSADDTSIPTDRSGKLPSPVRNEGTEEAKSFLIRALAPVTNLFKMRHQESSENKSWPENSTSESTGKDVSNLVTESDRSSKSKNIIASNNDNLVQLKAIRPIESGEKAWWLESDSDKNSKTNNENQNNSDKNLMKKITRIESGEKAWWLDSNSEKRNENNTNHTESSELSRPVKKCKFLDDEKPWWLDSSANIPEGVERLTPPRKSSSDSDKSEKFNFYNVRHMGSGDKKDWWLTSNENSTQNSKPDTISLSKSGSDQRSFPLRHIRHVESGERPWWLSSSKNIPEGIEKLPTPPPQDDTDSSESEEVEVYVPSSQIPPFPLHLPDDEPLGDRRSPEGLETPKENEDYRGRASPYENNRQYRKRNMIYQKNMDRYISRYTDIDDILGTSGQIYSPFMDSILARRTGQITYDDDDDCEEIDPTQVRIHDSTAQRPVIKKVRGRYVNIYSMK